LFAGRTPSLPLSTRCDGPSDRTDIVRSASPAVEFRTAAQKNRRGGRASVRIMPKETLRCTAHRERTAASTFRIGEIAAQDHTHRPPGSGHGDGAARWNLTP